jgi:ABC-2 type transport system permease protein
MQTLIRLTSFFEQWSAEVLRQPGLMFTLILAPFLLLLAFGDGVKLGGPRPRTLIVQPPDAQQSIEPLLEDLEEEVEIVGITESLPLARRALEKGDVDAVAVVPAEPNSFIENQERVPIRVLIGEIDPVRRSYARAFLNDQVAALNQRTVAEVLSEAQGGVENIGAITADARQYIDLLQGAQTELDETRAAVDRLQASLAPLDSAIDALDEASSIALVIPGLSRTAAETDRLRNAVIDLRASVDRLDSNLDAANDNSLATGAEIRDIEAALDEVDAASGRIGSINPEVLSAPFELELEDVTPSRPSFTAFYSPGVLALLVQHLAITLGALTMSRMRLLRVIDVLRVAPIRSFEVLLSHYISYGVLCAVTAAGLLLLLIVGLDVPVIGSYALVALSIGLLILCSLGVGFLASHVSSSVQQATQIAMLLLLASIFFGGFAFSLDRIEWPARVLSYLLPATYAIRTLQDVMLRGFDGRLADYLLLGGFALALLAVNVYLLRREMRAS